MNAREEHFDPETLAAFAEGRLDGGRREAVTAHLDHCGACMDDVAFLLEEGGHEAQRSRFRRSSWLLAIAAAVVIAVALPAIRRIVASKSPVASLVAAVPRNERLVEPRLSGGFPWATYHGPVRASGTGGPADPALLKLGGAAGDLIEKANHDSSAGAQHAAGVAMVLIEKPEEAAARLEAAVRTAPDAKTWSDLAAARYLAAVQFRRASLLPQALAAADESLRADPRLPEALFNRALILERLGLTGEARRAWGRYLEVDSASGWAAEARARQVEPPAATGSSRFERDQPLLEQAAVAGDTARVRALVKDHSERFRAFGEAEYLSHWAEATQQHDEAGASRNLTIARAIGDAEAQISGETLLREAVQAIDTSTPATRTTLAEAHVAYRRGRIAYSKHQLEAGERDLRNAAALFTAAGDPMAWMARYYAASVRLARNDLAGAHAELAQLRSDSEAHASYLALRAHVRFELARELRFEEEWTAAVTMLNEAAELYRRGSDPLGEARAEALLATPLAILGRADEAWSARIRAFHALSAAGQPGALERVMAGAADAELISGRPQAALALTRVAESLPLGQEPILANEVVLRRAMLESITGDPEAAALTLRRAEALVSRLTDADMRARQVADLDAARGAQLLARDPRAATVALTRAIEFLRARQWYADLPEPLLLRARCALRTGDPESAARDLEEGVAAVERHPNGMEGPPLGTGVLDAGHQLFTEAIRLRLDRGDVAGAFAYAERARGGETVSLEELKRRLAGCGTAVLEIVSLGNEVATIAISRDQAAVARRPRTAAELTSLAAASLAGDQRASSVLYDDVIRPLESVLLHAATVVVVPDATLAGVPFAALYDASTRRYLIEGVPVAIAGSASSLRQHGRVGSRALAGIVLPSAGGSAQLPDAERELADVAALYGHATTIPAERATWATLEQAAASADVVHIAGHTEREPGDTGQALLFADSTVSWKTIVAAPALHARVVVLAACETLLPARSADTRALSLGAAFAATGADVVGTLLPIPDRDAHTLFRAVHRELAAGAEAAAALRTVQLAAIHDETAGGDARAWRALAVVTRHFL